MHPRVRSSLLWGLVGALAFLVLVQGYELVADPPLDVAGKVAIAVLVGAAATGGTYLAERRMGATP